MTGDEGDDLFRPAIEILDEIQAALATPPEPITLTYAYTLDVDRAWPCTDWCCALGCPGPGNSLCMTPTADACPRWCTCGHQRVRDVVRALQGAVAAIPSGWTGVRLAWLEHRRETCRRPRWLPRWGWLHCWSCARSTPRWNRPRP